ncbi:MAG: hypothetical protein EOP42_14670 [Sphingobacteriaceae bacterium]|nr:MAG: hypothetical protein EOP42_14670 [Sphingobacteriaceae bacterium]
MFKLCTTVSGFQKPVKTSIAFIDENETQEDLEKKDDLKSNFNLNKDFTCLAENLVNPFAYLIISNLHPDFTDHFIADHFPTIFIPPPNC